MKKSSSRPPSKPLIVVEDGREPALAGFRTVTADQYLEGSHNVLERDAVVINLCRSYNYLSKGYYVSLLADARGQRAFPAIEMIEQITNPFAYFQALREAGVDTIDFKTLRGKARLLPKIIVPEAGRTTVLDVPRNGEAANAKLRYKAAPMPFVEVNVLWGRAAERRFQRPAKAVFDLFSFPALKMRMYREAEEWKVGQIFPSPFPQLSPDHKALLAERLRDGRKLRSPRPAARVKPRRVGCLFDPNDPFKPSWEDTLPKFERAALRKGALFEVIGPDDIARVPECDALLIRTFTGIDQPSFHFAQRARGLGIPVIDDPESIVKCSNKVYLHELFQREGVPTPRTLTVSRKTPLDRILELGSPIVIKLPQGSFSASVKKAAARQELETVLAEMFKQSPLLIVQEFTPSPFDWRIGILDRRVLFACKYFQAKDHWQIARRYSSGYTRYGKVEAVAINDVPRRVRQVALRGAKLIGDGLYGVDVKEIDGRALMIEVNDNPNIETGYEDVVEKDRLYESIIGCLLKRVARGLREGPKA